MAKDTPIPVSDPKIIHRFPRLPGDREVADLAQRVWESPTFSAKDVNGTTQFIFSVPIRSGFKRQSPSVYRVLFKGKRTAWTSALEKVYPETRSGRTKLIKDSIDTLLYKLFYEALLILNTETEDLTGDYTKFKEDFTTNFRAASPRTPGRRPIPNRDKRTIYLAGRYKALIPRLRELRNLVDKLNQSGIADSLLGMKVTEVFKEEWIAFAASGSAFEKLPGASSQGVSEIATTLGGKWAPWQATVGVIRCEEAKRDPNHPLGVVTIYKMIMAGRKLSPKPQNDQ